MPARDVNVPRLHGLSTIDAAAAAQIPISSKDIARRIRHLMTGAFSKTLSEIQIFYDALLDSECMRFAD
jgi:hypothetical protein